MQVEIQYIQVSEDETLRLLRDEERNSIQQMIKDCHQSASDLGYSEEIIKAMNEQDESTLTEEEKAERQEKQPQLEAAIRFLYQAAAEQFRLDMDTSVRDRAKDQIKTAVFEFKNPGLLEKRLVLAKNRAIREVNKDFDKWSPYERDLMTDANAYDVLAPKVVSGWDKSEIPLDFQEIIGQKCTTAIFGDLGVGEKRFLDGLPQP